MNLIILLAIVAMFVHNYQSGLGLVTGLAICYLFLDGRGKDSTIVWHLTHWSWWDINV
jgi:hypothetical protein